MGGLCVVVAGCGSSSSLKISAFHPWNLAQRVSYLNSCHKIALRLKSLQVTNKQRALYCNEQLQLAMKYNPKHKNVHGFVGAYSVSGGSGN